MKRLIPLTYVFVLLGLLLAPINPAVAQESSEEKTRTTIEIKDGKVLLNGEEIATLEDADRPVVFKRNRDGSSEALWYYDGDDIELENGFVVRRGAGENAFQLRGMPRAYGFMSRDGDGDHEVEVFDIERFTNTMREHEAKQRFNVEVMADRLAERVVEGHVAPSLSLYSTMSRSMTEEGREADRRSRELARMIRREDGDVDELEAELDAVLAKVFDEKQNAQQERIDEMRAKLAELEERLGQRQGDRDEIIRKRKNELLGRSSRYDW